MAPIVSRDQRQFWKHDVKLARNYHGKSRKNSVSDPNASINQKWADEFAEFQGSDAGRLGINAEMLRNVGRPAYQHTWSPMTFQHQLHPGHEAVPGHHHLNVAHPLQTSSQFRRHYSQSGAGSSKTVIYRRSSPPKYRSLVRDHIFGTTGGGAGGGVGGASQRRLSLAQFITSPPLTNGAPSGVNATAAANTEKRRSSSISTSASGHKFIVTPAMENSPPRK